MDESPLRQVVDELLAAWKNRNLDDLVALLDESVSWDDPAMVYGPAVGREAVKEFCKSVLRAYPDFAFRIRGAICYSPSDDQCVIPWQITATHLGPFDPPGLSPTNQKITMQGLDYITFSGKKVIRIETHFNTLLATQQALRLGRFPRKGLKKAILLSMQKFRAFWLRRSHSNE